VQQDFPSVALEEQDPAVDLDSAEQQAAFFFFFFFLSSFLISVLTPVEAAYAVDATEPVKVINAIAKSTFIMVDLFFIKLIKFMLVLQSL
jgi:hypothetical protein